MKLAGAICKACGAEIWMRYESQEGLAWSLESNNWTMLKHFHDTGHRAVFEVRLEDEDENRN